VYLHIEPECTNLYHVEGLLIICYYFCENFYRAAPVSDDGEFVIVNLLIVEYW